MKYLILLLPLLVGCKGLLGPEGQAAADRYNEGYAAAQEDGVVTAAEQAELDELAAEAARVAAEEGIPWEEVAWTAGGIILAGFGIRLAPNRAILGKEAADKLA